MTSERLMVAFAGIELPAKTATAIAERPVAGVTLFRQRNVSSAAQVRSLTDQLQSAAPLDGRPLLVAADQEGGQLIALGDDTTQFAGAMALGAAGDEGLAERVAAATARELRALGVNVNYSPVCDLATNRDNPALGIRSFGDDPAAVAGLAAATVRGLQAEGVAATVKHFPGSGEAAVDTHHELAAVAADRDQLERRELVPFRAALEAGARLVMAGHFALPGLTGDDSLPASLSERVLTGLLRNELGFDGLAITDALDMRALAQGVAQVVDVITAVRAGQDLLLATPDDELIMRLEEGLAQATLRGLIDSGADTQANRRLQDLRGWLAGFDQPSLEVVACAEHRAVAAELAERSITLVRNEDGLIPLRLVADARVAVVQSRPENLTPADTSANVKPTLAAALRLRFPATQELIVSTDPDSGDLAALRERAADYDVIVLGTFAAHLQPQQAELADAILAANRPTVTVALRTPWDLLAYPSARTHVCTYGILPPSMEALAAALTGESPFSGRLPVKLGELYPRGHGITGSPWH
jgi:beta-N-acetylhexosaminidase